MYAINSPPTRSLINQDVKSALVYLQSLRMSLQWTPDEDVSDPIPQPFQPMPTRGVTDAANTRRRAHGHWERF